MDIHRAVIPGVGVAPDHVHEVLPAVDPAGIAHEELDEVILFRRELHGLAVKAGGALLGIQGDAPGGEALPRDPLGASRPAEQGPDPGLQLQDVEGLYQVIVRPGLKAHELVGVLALGRQHDDGHVGELPDAHAGLQPVQLRHHHVQDDEVEAAVPGQLHGGGAVVGAVHLIALVLQVKFHTLH